MKSLDEVAASLQGYDPHALHADTVGRFLANLVGTVVQTEEVALITPMVMTCSIKTT